MRLGGRTLRHGGYGISCDRIGARLRFNDWGSCPSGGICLPLRRAVASIRLSRGARIGRPPMRALRPSLRSPGGIGRRGRGWHMGWSDSVKTMQDIPRERWAVVGGGFLGMTLALRLAQQGKAVTLFESADSLGG